MRRPSFLVLLLVLSALLVAGCTGDDDEDAAATTAVPATTAPPTTTETSEAVTTPDEVKRAIFERSYSECGSFSLARLAAKYKVARSPRPVANAVARAWTEQFNGGEDSVQTARDGCLQAIRETR